MFKQNAVRKGVLAIINERIDEKEVVFKEESSKLEVECESNIQSMKDKLVDDKDILLNKTIDDIIGKVLK